MKRLIAFLAALLVVTPVMAGEKELKEFKKQAIEQINRFYKLPPNYAAFEMTCYPAESFDGEGYHAGEFSVDFSSSGPSHIPFNVEIFKTLKEKNGFCVLGPMDIEARKQQALQRIDTMIKVLRSMEEFQKQRDKLQGETHTDPK